jgi:hypothetical protein
MPGVLHVADGKVVVEIVVEIERLLDVVRIAVRELNTGLLAPKQIGHEADETGLREFTGMMAHGVVDAPNLHDRNDRAGGGAIGDCEVRAHFAVAQFHRDVLCFHGAL